MSEPIDIDGKLRERLSMSLRQQEQLKKEVQSQLTVVSQLLQKVSMLAFGLDPELDVSLQRLSSLTLAPDQMSRSLTQLQVINDQLGLQLERQEKRLAGWQTSLSDTLKQLHHIIGLPGDLRRQLKNLLSDLHLPRQALYRLLPVTQDALGLLLKVVSLQRRSPDNFVLHPKSSDGEILDQLMTLVSSLDLSGAEHELHQIRRQLLSPMPQEALLDLCLDFLKVLVKTLDLERRLAKQFLSTASASLLALHKKTSLALEEHRHQTQEQMAVNEQVGIELARLQQALDVEDLTSMQLGLARLTALWPQKQELDQQINDQHRLHLEEMQQRLSELETQAQQYRDRLAQQRVDSLHDSLTQLPNRAAFDERLSVEHKRLQRFGHPLWLAILDVDHFKEINDKYGHSAGDKTLRFIAHTLRRSLRETDFIARFGGEEFVILFPELSGTDIERPLNKLREAVRTIPFKFKDEDVRISISIGATEVSPLEQPMTAFDRADQALYQAKHNGRDQVVILTQEQG